MKEFQVPRCSLFWTGSIKITWLSVAGDKNFITDLSKINKQMHVFQISTRLPGCVANDLDLEEKGSEDSIALNTL